MTLPHERLVEAALFSAGKPLAAEEICQATGLKPEEVQAALKTLHDDYASRDTSLEVVKSGMKWAMAIRTQYAENAKHLAPAEIPRRVLKTLALIAFHQPIRQSELKDMVGSVVYEHVHELHDRGMIITRQDGITKILTTTDRFAEYFGIDASDREQMRTELARRVGIELPSKTDPESPPSGDADAAQTVPAPGAENVANASTL